MVQKSRQDHDLESFVHIPAVGSARRVVGDASSPIPTASIGSPSVSWDAATCTQTAANVHTYRFYEGGLSGTLKQTIVLTYPSDETIPFSSVVYS